MGATSYRDLFQHALEESIGTYGDLSRVVTLVNVYQGADPIARQYAFDDWLEGDFVLLRPVREDLHAGTGRGRRICRLVLRAVREGGPAMTAAGRKTTRARTKTYKVSLHVEQLIYAEDEEEALGIFWDDLMRNQADGEVAAVEEVE